MTARPHAKHTTDPHSLRSGCPLCVVALGPGALVQGARGPGRTGEPVPAQPRGAGPAGPARARRPRRHDETAGHHEPPARLQRLGQSGRAQRGQLRSRPGQPLPGLAGPSDPRGRPQGHDCGDVVARAASRDRRGLRTRGLRSRARERAEGHVGGDRDRGDDRGRPAGRGPAGDRARRQLRSSRDHGRHPDGRGRAGPRRGTGSGPHDVRLGQHAR